MPTYAFRCLKCGNELEWAMTIADYSSDFVKPKCVADGCDGQQEMVSVPVLSHFSLKGTGWTPKFANGNALGPPTDIAMPRKR
jgi:predicted nucleic acid-binding Zn ribbon protein